MIIKIINIIKIISVITIIIIINGILFITSASAAQIYFGAPAKTVFVGQKFEVGVFLDTQQSPINAVESQILFSADALELEGFYDGNSIIPFWISKPEQVSPGAVAFSGIIPGGITTPKGYLFSLVLKPIKTGQATIRSSQETILLNDGQGTGAAINQAPLQLEISGKTAPSQFLPRYDATAPEPFTIQLGHDPNIFGGKYFVAFAAQDKGSGISHYQVQEMLPWWSAGRLATIGQAPVWLDAQSPYLLQDQSLQSDVHVKAIDQAGNARVAKLAAPHLVPWYQNDFVWVIIFITVIMIIIFIAFKR